MNSFKRRAKRVWDKENIPIRNIKRPIYDRRHPEHDYLKYWRVIRYWTLRKYNLKSQDLDMLLFLYSEGYFDNERFEEYNNVLSWDIDRFRRLLENGWIHVWREKTYNSRALYEITEKGRRAVNAMYKKLNREEISMDPHTNPMFLKDTIYSDKVMRNFIRKMNMEMKEAKRQRRQEIQEQRQRLAQVLQSKPLQQ
jgi:DNA-binding PadR family transcriptional regulator